MIPNEVVTLAQEAMNDILQKYDSADVTERADGILYVEGYKIINYFNEKFTLFWGGKAENVQVTTVQGSKDAKPTTVAVVTCNLSLKIFNKDGVMVLETFRPGVGADSLYQAKDIDKVVKTALTNALKKSAANFGNTLFLWETTEREKVVEEQGYVDKISERNRSRIEDMYKTYGITKQDMPGIIAEIFGTGVLIEGKTIKGNDSQILYNTKQDKILDMIIAHVRAKAGIV